MLNLPGNRITAQIEAIHTLAGELMLPRLLDKLMRLVIDTAEADKGVLLLPHQARWYIEAEGAVNQSEVRVLPSIPFETDNDQPDPPLISEAVVNYVIQTQQSLVLNDAAQAASFAGDRYLIKQQPKSVLGLPLLNQGRLTGLLYLESHSTTGVFTSERVVGLQLLSAQAAIAIDNARRYTELQSSEQKYRAIFENQTDMIMITATDGRIIDLNLAGERLLGYTRPEALRLDAPAFFARPADWARFQEMLTHHQTVQDFELRLRRKDGREIDTRVTATVWQADDGTSQGYQAIVRDITGQKEAAPDRLRASELQQAAADVANPANSALLAHMRHELRTPLNAIIGFSYLAMQNPANPADTQEQLSIISRSSEHLLTLINQMLDPTKVEAGPVTLNRQSPTPTQVIGLAPGQPRYRLLIVDDDPTHRQLLRRVLSHRAQFEQNFELEEAQNGQQALELWATFAPHLIWMDLRMPVMDGYEATQIIKSGQDTGQPIPKIIALTASSYDEKRAEVLAIGCDGFLRKPFREADIFALLEHHLGVQFVNAPLPEPAAASPSALHQAAPFAGLKAIPDPLRARLKKAALSGNMDDIETAIDQIQTHQPSLAAQFAQLAHAFDYMQIVTLLQRVDDE